MDDPTQGFLPAGPMARRAQTLYNGSMSDYFFPRAYQSPRRNTTPLTRLLQKMPEDMALEALDTIHWFEPVGYLDILYIENHRMEGQTNWTHPLNAVIWTGRPALVMAALEKASQALAQMEVNTVSIQVGRNHMFMNNWVSELVVHQAAQYAPPEVLEAVLTHLRSHKEGHNYLPVMENNKDNLWVTLGLHGRQDRPVKEWQKIIRLIDQQVMEEHPIQIVGKDGKHRQNVYQKRQRRDHHNLLFQKALAGGNDGLAQAVQGLRQVDVPLYIALDSALENNNARTALRVLMSPPTVQRMVEDEDIAESQADLARSLGQATQKWKTSRVVVREDLNAEEVREKELLALQQLTVFLVSDLKKFPLVKDDQGVRASYHYDESTDSLTPLAMDASTTLAQRDHDLPLLMAPALALLTAAEVEEAGIEWTQWPAQTDDALKGLPTLAEWMALPECPWQAARGQAVEQAMNDPTRARIYIQGLREEMARTKVDWTSTEGQRAADLVAYMFAATPSPVAAAQAWWELHTTVPMEGTPEDAARRQAWLAALLPPALPAKPKLRF